MSRAAGSCTRKKGITKYRSGFLKVALLILYRAKINSASKKNALTSSI